MHTEIPAVAGIPIEFLLFAAVLAGVALLNHHSLRISLIGVATIALYKLVFSSFRGHTGVAGLGLHLASEWVLIVNLLLLIVGFALLARHFEESRVPILLPRLLPDDWKGGFAMLVIVFVLSSFLDNIAAALIGGTMATAIYRGRVHVGFLAAIVAASNAGGSGSVVGDTTTTMMWIDGVSPKQVFEAYIAAVPALLFFGVIASRQQHAYQPITKDAPAGASADLGHIFVVAVVLAAAIVANVVGQFHHGSFLDQIPAIGIAVWLALLLAAPFVRPDWRVLPSATRGGIFLISLVLCASMMPIEALPAASWPVALGLGFVSAVFDNIPLTALALRQGGYDWGFVAYAVGFGGSMIWFGSSAGVALASQFPEARSAKAWIVGGWHVAVGYVLGFFILLFVLGWVPDVAHR
ncbi:MAG TPA: citrate transporter [Caldimonas sp.]|jgi:Na+/H+ antiporter NhaD/arsenite permease-like protein